jgi:hypothetical protein
VAASSADLGRLLVRPLARLRRQQVPGDLPSERSAEVPCHPLALVLRPRALVDLAPGAVVLLVEVVVRATREQEAAMFPAGEL